MHSVGSGLICPWVWRASVSGMQNDGVVRSYRLMPLLLLPLLDVSPSSAPPSLFFSFSFLFAYTSISYPIAQEPFFTVDRALRKSKDFSSYSTQRKAPEIKEAGTGGYFDKLAPLMVCSMSPRNHVHYTRQNVSEWDE
ncbi:hypothetical protein BKA56DRAFT_608260 [Ilyonectria sp. MPI-CAGE-AT-0026]|nr:hypothetical protein BKA56DRAFT_608260 [Ilyonectria sp. MPI-CAGE-AT-0026]